jgi:hypothetical protein
MTGKLHYRICTLVAGLVIHAALIANLPLVWCFDSNAVHAAERGEHAKAAQDTFGPSANSKISNTAAEIDGLTPPLNQKCVSHHKLINVSAPASKPAPEKDKFDAVVPSRDQLAWYSSQRIVQSTWADPPNFCSRLYHRSTVVLLI